MTTSIDTRASVRRPLATLHKPLLVLAIAMGVLVVPTLIAFIVDPRQVTGANVWLKPLKFEISVGIYAITLAWMIGLLERMRRVAWIAGLVATIGLAIEMVIIVGVAALGQTSHFNVSTPFHAVLWSVMAVSISVVWFMTFVVAIALFRNPLGDAARSIAIRSGVILSLVGMGLAFLMTGPTAAQLDNYQGIVGAHTVGVPDGGAGLPLLGWSTVAGDLRIPHFIGLHALQVLPLLVIVLELLASRWPQAFSAVIRRRLVILAVVLYAATMVVVTWQALIGQSIVKPSTPVLTAVLVVALVGVGASIAILARPSLSHPRG